MELEALGGISGEVLDIGCGLGDNAIYLASRRYSVTGLDGSPAAIEQARQRAAAAGVTVTFDVADATNLTGYDGRIRYRDRQRAVTTASTTTASARTRPDCTARRGPAHAGTFTASPTATSTGWWSRWAAARNRASATRWAPTAGTSTFWAPPTYLANRTGFTGSADGPTEQMTRTAFAGSARVDAPHERAVRDHHQAARWPPHAPALHRGARAAGGLIADRPQRHPHIESHAPTLGGVARFGLAVLPSGARRRACSARCARTPTGARRSRISRSSAGARMVQSCWCGE